MAALIDVSTLTIFSFDITTSEAHNHSVEWTSFPIEDDIDVSDHGHLQPDELSLEGVLTDTPLEGTTETSRAKALYEKLLELKDQRSPLKVITGLKVYTDMVITSVTATRDASSGRSVMPSIELKKIKIVAPEEIPAPEVAPGASPSVDLVTAKLGMAQYQIEQQYIATRSQEEHQAYLASLTPVETGPTNQERTDAFVGQFVLLN